ncbi:MAG: ubiquinol-cytochrome c reductase cytochrome b subunit [Pseudonocardiales bacterium]|nr:ubiquinol-cytochrome c reductase cytochrome b subunit [Pseudonocardiales bacterium]MBV9028827.1 ubiquinol-cytochrome c reductase cytochrome b subunit [Pseudonocardiales bacterium]
MSAMTTPTTSGGVAAKAADELDQRFHLAAGMRRQINKVFPTHWSFMLGEIALNSFIVLLLSGTYLTLFFDPSMQDVTYNGVYRNLRGIEMSRAFESTLQLSFDVRGGLFVRQVHHWAALLFVAAIVAHMFRTFFTGAFRKPRETNWTIGVTLAILAGLEGLTGYSLPDDLLSGTGLRIISSIIMSPPVIGTWLQWAIFGGLFPGNLIIPRFFIVHVLLIPGILVALIAVHLGLVWYQKHTQFPGPGRTERNVVGVRILPIFVTKAGGFAMVNIGVICIMAGLFQINPIWNFGPYNPAQVSAASQPDWYVGWLDGSTRLWPAWESYLGNYMIPASFWPTMVLPGIMFALTLGYPAIERKLTKDNASHNLLQRPRDVPVRTGLGMMAASFMFVLLLSGGNDVIAYTFDISLNATTWAGRIGLLLLPPISYYVTYRICLGLQRADRAILEHGIETGIIKRLPHGEFIEVHQPLGGTDGHGHPIPLEYQGARVPKRMNQLGSAGAPVPGSLFRPDPSDQTRALESARQQEAAGRINGTGRELAGRPQQPRD